MNKTGCSPVAIRLFPATSTHSIGSERFQLMYNIKQSMKCSYFD